MSHTNTLLGEKMIMFMLSMSSLYLFIRIGPNKIKKINLIFTKMGELANEATENKTSKRVKKKMHEQQYAI